MKTTIFASVLAASLLIGTCSLFAQHPIEHSGSKGKPADGRDMHSGIPNLTDEQKAKIKDLRLANFKEMQPLRNQLGELKAKQRTLTTMDKPDIKAIDANIDEISKVTNQLMKIRAAHHQQVRVLLTDEQKIWFDSHPFGKGRHGHKADKMEHHHE